MKKNNLALRTVLVMLALLASLQAGAYDFVVDGLCYNKNSDGKSVTVTYQRTSSPRYTNLSGEVIIPSSVTYDGVTYSVTAVGSWAFDRCYDLTNMTIPNSVTYVGEGAFNGCSGLTGELVIPNSVTSIGNMAFYGCSGFNGSLTIPNSVISIGSSAFGYCSGFNGSLTIPNSVISIGSSAFEKCSGFNGTLTIPNSVISIGSYAFRYCRGLTGNLEIPNSVTSIGVGAFSNCSGLTSATIGNSVTALGKYFFENCENLASVTLPNSVVSIGESAFRNCYGLRDVYAYWLDPPRITQLVFANSESNTVSDYYDSSIGSAIHIPTGTTSNYKAKVGWKNFYAIEDLDNINSTSCLVLNNEMALLQLGETLQLTVLTENIGEITWTSDNETIATVDSNGLVTAVSPGLVCVRATDANGISSFCAITSYLPGDLNNDGVVDENDVPGGIQKCFKLAIDAGDIVLGNINTNTMMPIALHNTGDITAFSCTVALPERVELVDDVDSFIEATERGAGFAFSASQNEDGTITVTGTTAGEPLAAGDGPVLNLKVKTQWQNTYTIPVTNITITTADGTVKQLPDSATRLVMQGVRGDMNGDGRVDASDALYIYHLASGLAE